VCSADITVCSSHDRRHQVSAAVPTWLCAVQAPGPLFKLVCRFDWEQSGIRTSSATCKWSRRPAVSSSISSPFSTRPRLPPTADSGQQCRMIVPKAVPDIRQSLIRTISFTPARASFLGTVARLDMQRALPCEQAGRQNKQQTTDAGGAIMGRVDRVSDSLGMYPASGIPGAPTGPAPLSTSTSSGVTSYQPEQNRPSSTRQAISLTRRVQQGTIHA
jgi:hypothetical protein